MIHAAVMGQDLGDPAALIDRRRETRCGWPIRAVGSIALPAFGTGVGGFPIAECARIMIEAVRAHAAAARSLRLVRFVLFGQTAYRAFEEIAASCWLAASRPARLPGVGVKKNNDMWHVVQ